MADAARLAHHPGFDRRVWSRGLAAGLCLGLALGPASLRAQPAGGAPDAAPAETPAEPAPASGDVAGSDEAKAPEPVPAEPADEGAPDEEVAAANDATAEDDAEGPADEDEELVDDEGEGEGEGEGDDAPAKPPTGEPLRPMQTAAWWTMFGAFAVGTTAGVLGGLAERQEDRATRLSTLFDAETGAQPLYADRKEEYEQYLRRGQGYARAAIGVGIVSGVAAITAITLFAIDARRERGPKGRNATLRPSLSGLEVRF